MLRKLRLFTCLLFLTTGVFSQPPVTWTSADMYLALRKLNVLGSVLYIAAHPDDENTRLLAYFSKDRMYRTGYLSMTRGDGGQNLIGDEQGFELGLIRTQELLSARRIDGAEQFFTRAYDFGYSKGPGETFTKWDKEKILSDVVWVIRKFQPDILITRFPTTGEGGHGHHTASAILANEAFTAAADPTRFPDQLKYVNIWQAKRILWNTFNFGNTNTISNDQFKFDVGGYNPLLGKSYGEIAAASRSQHKSQGFGVGASRGQAMEYFRTTGGPAPETDIMDGVELTWKRINGGERVAKAIDSVASSFDLLHPEKSVKGLVLVYKLIKALPAGYWKEQKLKEVQQLVQQCSGLFMEATANEQFAVQSDSIRINFFLNNRLGVPETLRHISVDVVDSALNVPLEMNHNVFLAKELYVPFSKPLTQPYWLENKMEEGYFNVTDQQKIGQPDVDPAYVTDFTVNIEGENFVFSVPVKYKFTDPVRGEVYEPLVVVNPVHVTSFPEVVVINKAIDTANIPIVFKSFANGHEYSFEYSTGTAPHIKRNNEALDFSQRNSSLQYNLELSNDKSHIQDSILLETNNRKDTVKEIRSIAYNHIPTTTYFKDAEIRTVYLDIKTVGKRLGYIVGAGDKVPEALEQMGYNVTILGDKELSRNTLQQYDAIITGVRAYNTEAWLNNYYDKLMKYVYDGGNLIVQYNTSNNIGPVRAKIGPYNFDISRTRVTDETAEVTFVNPNLSVLHFPNEITQNDFTGWIQERSIYHATNFDRKNFETVFAMHDPGEAADDGSLIIAHYGKGMFVYTGLVFFRELPAGVPGAYRLFANIIALNKQKAF